MITGGWIRSKEEDTMEKDLKLWRSVAQWWDKILNGMKSDGIGSRVE